MHPAWALLLGTTAGGYWSYDPQEAETRSASILHFSTRADLWFSTFNRPPRACDPNAFGILPSLNIPNGGLSSFCNTTHSNETGIGTGLEVTFRAVAPIYVFAGIDLIYTLPDNRVLKNQIVIPAPFGVLVTFYEWTVRPIVRGTITPLVYLTDDARDFTLGGDLGLAWRVLDWGDLSFTLGYKSAATIKSWQIEIAIHPVP